MKKAKNYCSAKINPFLVWMYDYLEFKKDSYNNAELYFPNIFI